MRNIWAPWRTEYISKPKDVPCVFCSAPSNNGNLILKKGKTCFSIMNRYPYTTGHCMVAPYRHVGDLNDLDEKEIQEIFSMVKELITAIRASLRPEGFNIGCNLGKVAGAGFADHIHVHVVPRWTGDTNFMPVLADVHMISEHIEKTKEKIKESLY